MKVIFSVGDPEDDWGQVQSHHHLHNDQGEQRAGEKMLIISKIVLSSPIQGEAKHHQPKQFNQAQ